MSETAPFLEPVLEQLSPTLRAFLDAFLPTVALLVFISILPAICMALAGLVHPSAPPHPHTHLYSSRHLYGTRGTGTQG